MQNVSENRPSTVDQQCRKDVWCVWRARGHGKLQSWQFSSRKPILNSILESSYAWPRRQREADLHFYSTLLPLKGENLQQIPFENVKFKHVAALKIAMSDSMMHADTKNGRRSSSLSVIFKFKLPSASHLVVNVCTNKTDIDTTYYVILHTIPLSTQRKPIK